MSHPQPGQSLDDFKTTRPSNPVFCHQEFLEKLAEHARDGVGKRTSLLLQRLAVDPSRLHYKPTQGVNRGWRRSRLGGGGGSHFYAWWAPRGSSPLKDATTFGDAPDGALFLRDIRHHDDHSPLNPHSFVDNYLPVSVRDLRHEEYGPAPWTQGQARFASARQPVRILKGHPGSGKTTALWHAVDETQAERVLYVTYSRDLAALALDHFDRYCSAHRRFHVATFSGLLRELLASDEPVVSERQSRRQFQRELGPFHRTLGPWADRPGALYDEMHAHLIGDALPVRVGRFSQCSSPRVSDSAYRERRTELLGPSAVTTLLDIAGRMEREGNLAERFFPELLIAWQLVARLREHAIPAELLNYDCIAVDECQDLTAIEASVLIEMASQIRRQRRSSVPVLFAGDEAQTVRPTDFEWGWLNDLLHTQLGTPTEFRLAANLRSPRRIAEMVNRVWDLYSQLDKRERPSGAGLAEIDDDATDQIYYCTALPGPELTELLEVLATREGLAIISLDDTLPAFLPESVRPAVLTVNEAKGLDFHSVCVLDAGRQLERVVRYEAYLRPGSDIENLRKRLAIDQLRVAFSRPTERLIWIDVNPSDEIVRQSLNFLNSKAVDSPISASIPAAILKSLEEDQLDLEERIQRCQLDARQYLDVKPEIAWSRAQQAVGMLGRPDTPAAITDQALRQSAYLTLAEVCFCLGMRKVRLAAELGKPDLFAEASRAAIGADRRHLAVLINSVQIVQRSFGPDRLKTLIEFAQYLGDGKNLESWFLIEMRQNSRLWVDELEMGMSLAQNASRLLDLLPPFYEVLKVPDAEQRIARLRQRAVTSMIKEKRYRDALDAMRTSAGRNPKLEATCHEGLGDYRAAAECYKLIGDLKEALRCYRTAPDFEAALALVREIGEHPAAESLEWVARLRSVIAERPDKFTKLTTPAEKKLLQDLLEQSLGVTRRKAAPRKTAAPKKTAVRKVAVKKTPALRKRVLLRDPF